jgi:acyl-CoA thioester hydrolase
MYTHETTIRVSYADTDQMGLVHHSNYAIFCETARWEAMRELGICYKDMEDNGMLMPVISMKFDFIKPAYYDELITIKTTISKMPKARMKFEYELYNENKVLINKAEVCLAFVKKDNNKPCFPPEYCLTALKKYFSENN